MSETLSYREALEQLEEKLDKRINPERSRLFQMSEFERRRDQLRQLGSDPRMVSKALRISIVGSNGKGSTAHYLSGLYQDWLKKDAQTSSPVGLYTSPHLQHVNERIRLDSIPADPRDLLRESELLDRTFISYTGDLSYFEYLTVLAIHLFRSKRCAIEIYEAGLGGRLDATSMAGSEIVVLTTITTEHTELLGSDPRQIQREKLGIVSSNTRHVFLRNAPDIDLEDAKHQIRKSAPFASIHISEHRGDEKALQGFDSYLAENFAYARFIVETTTHTTAQRTDSSSIQIPGRLEQQIWDAGGRRFNAIFDTAHNPQAIGKAMQALHGMQQRDDQSLAVVFGILKERSCEPFIEEIKRFHQGSLIQLTGDDFCQPCDGVLSLPIARMDDLVAILAQTPGVNRVLFAGSHRLYEAFLLLVQGK